MRERCGCQEAGVLLPRSVKGGLVLLVAAGTLVALVVTLSLLYATLVRQMQIAIDDGLRVRAGILAGGIRSGTVTVPRQEAMAQVYAADGRGSRPRRPCRRRFGCCRCRTCWPPVARPFGT